MPSIRLFVSEALSGAFLFALVATSGCRCGEDRPYTPFGVTSALPAPPPSASVALLPSANASASAEPPTVEKALLAPANSKRWLLEGRELAAPPGQRFEQAVVADFDGNGTTEAAAWLRPEPADAGPSVSGELWLFPAQGEPQKLAKVPDFVPTGPSCRLTTTLGRTGPHTLTFDAMSTCTGAFIARSPVRALVVVAPTAERSEIQMLRVAAAAPDETLELAAATNDRDGDGRDDAAIHVSVGRAGAARFTAPFVWLDRAVGPARDTSEPRATLERLAAQQATRAKSKKLAQDVLSGVAGIRRLMSSLCAEGAAGRVFDRDGGALPCGNLGSVVDSLATAEISAELARGAVLEAFASLSRDGWYFGKASANTRKRLERTVLETVEPLPGEVTRVVARPVTLTPPHYSPLAFDSDGSLLVVTADGVVRAGPGGSTSPVLEEGGAPLTPDVSPSPGQRWQGVAYSCDRSETALFFTQGAAFVTPLLAPRPGACGRAPFEAAPPPAAVCAEGGRIAAVVGGSLVGECGGAPRGSTRSANGKWLAVPTPFGLLLDGPGPTHRLLSFGNVVERPLELANCVAADDGRKAACLLRDQVLLLKAPAL